MIFNPGRDILRNALPVLAALLLTACATVNGEIDQETAIAELTTMQDAWVAAEIAGDADMLETLMYERCLSTFSSGQTLDRQGYIDWIVSQDIKPFSAELESVDLYGDTAVVVTLLEGTKITWVAIRSDGRWRAISQVFTKRPVDGL
jgi:hypothetical protein